MNILVDKLKEVLFAVLPITGIVLLLHFTITPLDTSMLIRLLVGALFIIIGLSIFLSGVDMGITPIGNVMGSTLAKTNKITIVVCAGLALGFFISIAEPDLHILAGQVEFVSSGLISMLSIVVVVSLGIALMVSLGLSRIVYNVSLSKVLTGLYALIFVLAILTSPEFLAISFDASGATTGALTVPFLLALAMGVSMLKRDSQSSETDSFGLVAIASAGAIIAVMLMSIISRPEQITATMQIEEGATTSILLPFIQLIPTVAEEILLALFPILCIFIVFQKIAFKLSRNAVRKIMIGAIYTFIGLVFFIVGVNAGFMDAGRAVGYLVTSLDNKAYVVIVGFLLGLVTILAEPAVYVLTHQIENVTSGYVKRKIVMVALALGVGSAVALSIIRILVPGLQLWHYLLPGYVISIALSHYVPPLFVGMAFDSGGVASGPMTATFILAFAQGAAEAIEGANVLVDGFGVIAMVAMTPIIALQVLGVLYKINSRKRGVETDG